MILIKPMSITLPEFEEYLEDASFPLAVAVSGGADSLCLLLLAHKLAQQNGGRVIALTVDHGLRAESKDEVRHLRKWTNAKGIEHIILEWKGQKPTSCLQEKAREARYHLLTSWCQNNHIPTLLLGHHQQDQIETFWMRLSSGSGLDGLTGMKKRVVRDGITYIRPFLGVPKERLKATLTNDNETWIEDPSNDSHLFFRGRIRSFLHEEGLSEQRLMNIMEKLKVDADFIQDALLKTIRTHVHLREGGYITLERHIFEDLHPALAKRLLSYLIHWFSGNHYPSRTAQVDRILENLKKDLPFTAGSIYWFSQDKEILLMREPSQIQKEMPLDLLDKDTLWDHRYWIQREIKSHVPQGTVLAPVGHISSLKKEIQSTIPSRIWPTLPALWCKGKLVSIPHCCYHQDSEMDYRKFFYLKPLFYDLLKVTI